MRVPCFNLCYPCPTLCVIISAILKEVWILRRIRMVIQYDGTEYVGWQRQPNGLAVQEVIENELSKLTGEHVTLYGSGRTDSGVHALSQVAHFDTDVRMPGEKFCYALNVGLPRDIRILYSEETDPAFHARFDVQKKSYRYYVLNSTHDSPFLHRCSNHIHYHLDIDAMQSAAKLFCGEHDFNAFKASGSAVDSTVRTIFASEWSKEGELLCYDVTGNGFLYNMVRIMVGTMLEIGLHRCDESVITSAFGHCDRTRLGVTAPAKGLFVARVQYSDFDTADFVNRGYRCF